MVFLTIGVVLLCVSVPRPASRNTTSAIDAVSKLVDTAFRSEIVQDGILRSYPISLVASIVVNEFRMAGEDCAITFPIPPVIHPFDTDLVASWRLGVNCIDDKNFTVDGRITISNDETGFILRDFRVENVNGTVKEDYTRIKYMLNFVILNELTEDKLTQGARQLLSEKFGLELGRLAQFLDRSLKPKPSRLDALGSQTLLQADAVDDAIEYVQTTVTRIGNGKGLMALVPTSIATTFGLRAVGAPETYVKAASCFSHRQRVQTLRGGQWTNVTVGELAVGDVVLSSQAVGEKLQKTQIFFKHCVESLRQIISLSTAAGTVSVTPTHLVAAVDKVSRLVRFVKAEKIHIGDWLVSSFDSDVTDVASVINISYSIDTYCDLKTETGDILVDGVLASVASTSHIGSKLLWTPMRWISLLFPELLTHEKMSAGVYGIAHTIATLYQSLPHVPQLRGLGIHSISE